MARYSIHSDSQSDTDAGYAVFTTDHGYQEATDAVSAAVQDITAKTDAAGPNPSIQDAAAILGAEENQGGAFVAAVVNTDTFETTLVELRPNVTENKWDGTEAAFPEPRDAAAFNPDSVGDSTEDDDIGGLLSMLLGESAFEDEGVL